MWLILSAVHNIWRRISGRSENPGVVLFSKEDFSCFFQVPGDINHLGPPLSTSGLPMGLQPGCSLPQLCYFQGTSPSEVPPFEIRAGRESCVQQPVIVGRPGILAFCHSSVKLQTMNVSHLLRSANDPQTEAAAELGVAAGYFALFC